MGTSLRLCGTCLVGTAFGINVIILLIMHDLTNGLLFLVSMSFQFVGFLLTYLLHTSHAAKVLFTKFRFAIIVS